ncbi:hypothetical protein MSAN_02084600 [Mycena sanguinolenta]|uniref:Uncharacterized protein n=1 Tax=Mycena sanguinolenta TaxID=230812 RepID=A0A8H7CM46_9AGAR|nr:hypothetical protein MSAN_02084600 [Mycena sanguinolenta]
MFHRIAHPLLFRDLEFHPYVCLAVTNCPPSGLLVPEEERISSLFHRLQFWSSPDIARLVRTCRVSDWSNEDVILPNCGTNGRTFRRAEDPYILLTAFFDALPRFASLPTGLLRNLRILEVNLCSVVQGEVVDTGELASLHVTQFTFRHHPVAEPCVENWVPLLNPLILTHMNLAYNEGVLAQIVQATTTTFPCVRSLNITMRLSLPSWSQILSKFPAIEVLQVKRFRCDNAVSEPREPLRELLPALSKYTGPAQLLQFLVPIPTLRRVSVSMGGQSLDDIVQSASVTSTANNVTSLQAKIIDMATNELFFEAVCAMCSVFSRLTELHLKIVESPWCRDDWDSNAFKPEEFLEELEQQSPLPMCIQKLALHWDFPAGNPVGADDFGPPDLNSVKDALVAEYPELRMIWVQGSGIMYLWRRERGATQHAFEEPREYMA